MTRVPRLLLGRVIAVLQGVIWFVNLNGSSLQAGWLLGLVALGATIAARRLPTRSALLLLAPATLLALVESTSVARSRLPLTALETIQIASLIVPAVLAAALIRPVARRHAADPSTMARNTRSATIRKAVMPAMILAALSVAPVALALEVIPSDVVLANTGWAAGPIDWRPMDPIHAIALSIVVVLAAAVAGGAVGSFALRSGPIWGGVAALTTAWAAAIITLPLAAAALSVHLRTGIVCVMGCEAMLRDDQPLGGPAGYAMFVLGTAIVVWPLVAVAVIAAVVGTVAPVLRRRSPEPIPRPTASSLPASPIIRSHILRATAVGGFAVAHGAGLALTASSGQNGLVPYVCLSVGVVAWVIWLESRSARAEFGRPDHVAPPVAPSGAGDAVI